MPTIGVTCSKTVGGPLNTGEMIKEIVIEAAHASMTAVHLDTTANRARKTLKALRQMPMLPETVFRQELSPRRILYTMSTAERNAASQ